MAYYSVQCQTAIEKGLRQALKKTETELERVTAELLRVQRTSIFLQAWDEDMFVAPVADVWLKTTDKPSAPIAAHRSVLASKSPVFKAMLFNNTTEKKPSFVENADISKDCVEIADAPEGFVEIEDISEGFVEIEDIKEGTVEIADISSEVLQAIVTFIYKGDVKDNFLAENVLPLLDAAIKFDIAELRQICIAYILDNSIPTAPYEDGEIDHLMCLLELALKYDLKEVKGAVIKKLYRNGVDVVFREVKKLLVCDRFRSLREIDPVRALEICESVSNP